MTPVPAEPASEIGVPDVQTVTRTGEPTLRTIDGVVVHTPVTHVDHRGWVFEIHNLDPALGAEPVVWVYADMVRPGQVKGWARHVTKIDRYTVLSGDLLVLLHDGREDSPSHGVTQSVVLSPAGPRQLRIPVGVWHLIATIGTEETHFVNLPTEPYHHEAPDRILLPWDTDEIPVDVQHYLAKH
jgi:dTDP-4-dehydrorhamnose 3,5-epimerase